METERLIEMVVMARQGDENAMQTLYLDTKRSVYYLALRMVKNPEDAEDITQEVFITVHEKLSELREPAAFYKWINQITANKCNALLRKYKGIALLDDGEEVLAMLADDDPLNLPDRAIDDEDTRRIILAVIDALPDAQRICVMLYYYQQNTITQIADMLETNENTVKTRLSLARVKIRAALEEKEKKEGIKLYGIPLALTPILRQAAQDFQMPEDVSVRIWENVSRAMSEATPGSGQSGTDGGASAAASQAAGTAAAGTGMALAAKIIIGVVATAVIAAGAMALPRLVGSPPEETPPPATTDMVETPGTPEATDDIPREPENEHTGNESNDNVAELDITLTPEQLALLLPLEKALYEYDMAAVFPIMASGEFQEICSALPEGRGNRYKVDERGEWLLEYQPYSPGDDANFGIWLITEWPDGALYFANVYRGYGETESGLMETRDIINGTFSGNSYNTVRAEVTDGSLVLHDE